MTQEQLRIDLPRRSALGRDSFFVTPANDIALALVEAPPRWPAHRLLLVGPAGSGKTHLAHVWAGQAKAKVLWANDLVHQDIPALAKCPLCIEAVDAISGRTDAEEALFHLMNLMGVETRPLLMTARTSPTAWGLGLADLRSRIEATTLARLDLPDDVLLSAVLSKQFADRQIVPADSVIPYLVTHMPRSFAAAGWLVDRIDTLALGTRGGATRDKAITALSDMDKAGLFQEA